MVLISSFKNPQKIASDIGSCQIIYNFCDQKMRKVMLWVLYFTAIPMICVFKF